MSPENLNKTDEELLLSAISGNLEAFGSLYERYLVPVFRYIYYRVGDIPEAEDLTETVFLKAWEAVTGLDKEKLYFRAWIYRIAHNVIVDHHRTKRLNVSLDQVYSLETDIERDKPENAYEISETTQTLVHLIQQLDSDLQQVIIYRFILGYSHAETARQMGLSEGYARVLQHRGLAKMRDIMMEEVRDTHE